MVDDFHIDFDGNDSYFDFDVVLDMEMMMDFDYFDMGNLNYFDFKAGIHYFGFGMMIFDWNLGSFGNFVDWFFGWIGIGCNFGWVFHGSLDFVFRFIKFVSTYDFCEN